MPTAAAPNVGQGSPLGGPERCAVCKAKAAWCICGAKGGGGSGGHSAVTTLRGGRSSNGGGKPWNRKSLGSAAAAIAMAGGEDSGPHTAELSAGAGSAAGYKNEAAILSAYSAAASRSGAAAAAAAAAVRAPDSDSDSDGAVEVTIDIPVKIEVPQHESRVDPASYTYAQHVVYEVKIQYHGESWTIFRRYSEFAQLVRELLSKAVAEFELPELPAKQYGLFQPTEEFLVERRGGLEMFLQQLVAGTWTDPASPFFEITQERLQEEFPFFRVDAAAPDVGASDPAGPSDPDATNPYADGMVAGPTGETGATPAGADQSAEGAEPAAASDANAEAEKPRSWFW